MSRRREKMAKQRKNKAFDSALTIMRDRSERRSALDVAREEWARIPDLRRRALVRCFQQMGDDEWNEFWADLDVPF